MKAFAVIVVITAIAIASVAAAERREGLLDSLMAGQQIRTRDGTYATIEAVEGNTRAAVQASSGSKQHNKATHQFRLDQHLARSGAAIEATKKSKTQDGGSTSVIANRNFMSILEDEDGNTIPNSENTQEAERNLAAAAESLNHHKLNADAAPAEVPTKHGPEHTAPVTPVRGHHNEKRSASTSAAEGHKKHKAKRAETNTEAVTEEAEATAATTEEPRFKSQRVSSAVNTQAEEQRLEQEAGRINALAEVNEALEDAARTNARNQAHAAKMRSKMRR